MVEQFGAPLTDAELGLVQRYIDRMVEENLELGLSSEIEHDFEKFAHYRSKNGFLYPSFDPRVSDLDENAVWVRVVTQYGDTVALTAARVFTTDNFFELLRNEKVWYRSPPAGAGTRCAIFSEGFPEIKGAVAHAGGLWVDPLWRKRGLSRTLPWLMRGLLLRNFGVDHVTSLVHDCIAASGLPKNAYGFTLVEKVLDGYFPPTGEIIPVYLCHITRSELLARMAAELSEPVRLRAAIG